MQVSLTRTVTFPAQHRMYRREWSDNRNREAFGDLVEYHGHDYACTVTVGAILDPQSGMVMDLGRLDGILKEEVVEPLQGQQLNDLVTFPGGHQPPPTCEALAAWLFRRIAVRLPRGVTLERVRVAEDPELYADCTG